MEMDRGPDQAPSVDERVQGEDSAGRPAMGTPPIGDEGAVKEQTQVPAADDDVGVPPDGELGQTDE